MMSNYQKIGVRDEKNEKTLGFPSKNVYLCTAFEKTLSGKYQKWVMAP